MPALIVQLHMSRSRPLNWGKRTNAYVERAAKMGIHLSLVCSHMRAFLGCVTTVADTHPYCLGSRTRSLLPQLCSSLLEGRAMSFSVSFLGHRYELPDAILDYLKYERMASRIMGSSLDLVIEKVGECKVRDVHSLIIELEETREPYQMLMISMAEEYIKELIAKGVFDISAIELLERTNGFDELDKLANEVLGRHLEEAKRILSNQLDEVQRAYSSAESSITGSGVSVYTSSALTLMASGVFETGVLRSQAKKADREFNEACSAIEAQTSSATARNDAHAIFGEFLPALSELMLDLCNQLLSAFLTELAARDLFDFDSLKSYNLLKAEKMLGNIKLVPDPEVLLNQAFVTCPYCGEIYKWIFSLGMMDVETFSTAETLGLSEELIGELENYCRQNVDKPEVFDRYLSILLEHSDTSRSDAILEMFKDDIEKAEAGYRGLQGLFSEDSHSRDVSIEKMLVKNDELKQASKLIVMDAVEVGRAIEAAINSIIGIPIGECLVREGLVGKLRMPVCGDEQTFGQLCKSLVEDVAQLIVDYGNRLHPHINSCLDFSEAILREIDRRKELIADKRLKASDTIEQLESLKGRLRLRDVDLRWEVDNQANAVRRELEDLIVRCNIESLKKLRVDVVREGDSILSCHLDNSEVKAMGGMHFADIDSSSFDKLLDIEMIERDVEHRIDSRASSQQSDQFKNPQVSEDEQKDGNPQIVYAKKKKHLLVVIAVLVAISLIMIGYSVFSHQDAATTSAEKSNTRKSESNNSSDELRCSMQDLESFFTDLYPYLDYLGTEVSNRELVMPAKLISAADSVKLGNLKGEIAHKVSDSSYVHGDDFIETIDICQWRSNGNLSRDEYKEVIDLLREYFDSTGQREHDVEIDVGIVTISIWEDETAHANLGVFLDEDGHLYFRWVLPDDAANNSPTESNEDLASENNGTIDGEDAGGLSDGDSDIDEAGSAQSGASGSTGYGGAGRPGEW